MQFETPLTKEMQNATDPKIRKDPSGFVMSMALTLMAITLLAVLTMQLAQEFGWQIL
jgi:hypothetical protein